MSSCEPSFTYSRLFGSSLVSGYSSGSFSRTVSYEPSRDLIAAVTNAYTGALVSAFGYANDAAGRRTAIGRSGAAFGDLAGATDAYGYNERSEVTSSRRTLGGAAVRGFDNDYAYDPIGSAPSEARRFLQGGSPCRVRTVTTRIECWHHEGGGIRTT